MKSTKWRLDMNQPDYFILEGEGFEDLQRQVNSKLESGWRLVGQPFFSNWRDGVVYQAMLFHYQSESRRVH